MHPDPTPDRARALYAEMAPRYEPHLPLPELERTPPHGRLRAQQPAGLLRRTWTFPAHAMETREYVVLNVGLTTASWGLPVAVADELGNEAAAMSAAATEFPGARQTVTVAFDGTRVILGVICLTAQPDVADLLEPKDPGVVEAVRERTTASGILDLPAGPGLFTVVELGALAQTPHLP